ncbi:MAG: type VI secretion system-associated protein TagF [Pseudomonadota bacterium]
MYGFYGKMPGHGDFVRSKADPGFVAAWDTWLQASFSDSRTRLGDAWQAAYEAMPIWRFTLPGGVCGDDPILGVMMPSQDRVGRMFPLTVFARLKMAAGQGALDAEPLMTELEDAALETLDCTPQDRLRARLDAMAAPDTTDASDGATHWLSTFFGGAARRDTFSFAALPSPARFTQLLNPGAETANV